VTYLYSPPLRDLERCIRERHKQAPQLPEPGPSESRFHPNAKPHIQISEGNSLYGRPNIPPSMVSPSGEEQNWDSLVTPEEVEEVYKKSELHLAQRVQELRLIVTGPSNSRFHPNGKPGIRISEVSALYGGLAIPPSIFSSWGKEKSWDSLVTPEEVEEAYEKWELHLAQHHVQELRLIVTGPSNSRFHPNGKPGIRISEVSALYGGPAIPPSMFSSWGKEKSWDSVVTPEEVKEAYEQWEAHCMLEELDLQGGILDVV
jgi:hypothetical protein